MLDELLFVLFEAPNASELTYPQRVELYLVGWATTQALDASAPPTTP